MHGITDEGGNGGASVSVELGRRVIRDLVVEARARLDTTISTHPGSAEAQCHRDVEEVLRRAMDRWGWAEPGGRLRACAYNDMRTTRRC